MNKEDTQNNTLASGYGQQRNIQRGRGKRHQHHMPLLTVDKATEIARAAHAGQQDKQGQEYILHPLRVRDAVNSDDAKIVAILHDVVEDTAVTVEELRAMGLTETQEAALFGVTRLITNDNGVYRKETYKQFIQRVADMPGQAGVIAREVKLADLADNLGRMIPELGDMAEKRYIPAQQKLREAQQQHGDPTSLQDTE